MNRWLRALLALLIGAGLSAGAAWGLSRVPWMAWTAPTAWVFAVIAGSLLLMTAAEVLRPTRERQGWLPMPTTRGDRFFLGLVGVALIHVPFVAHLDTWPLWPAWLLSGLWVPGVLWKG